jgi:hypothetical protein
MEHEPTSAPGAVAIPRAGGGPAAPATLSLEGEIRRRPLGGGWRLVAAFTGLLLAWHVFAALARYALGLRRAGRVSVDGRFVRVETELRAFGATLRRSTSLIPVHAVLFMERREGVAPWALAGGAIGLAAGLLLGFAFLVEWSRSLLGVYVIAALGCVIAGVAVDLAVARLAPRLRGRTALVVMTYTRHPAPLLLLTGAPAREVERFVEEWAKAYVVSPTAKIVSG